MFCKYCGNKIDSDACFCTYCGSRLAEVAAMVEQPDEVAVNQPAAELAVPEENVPKTEEVFVDVAAYWHSLKKRRKASFLIIGCVIAAWAAMLVLVAFFPEIF